MRGFFGALPAQRPAAAFSKHEKERRVFYPSKWINCVGCDSPTRKNKKGTFPHVQTFPHVLHLLLSPTYDDQVLQLVTLTTCNMLG